MNKLQYHSNEFFLLRNVPEYPTDMYMGAQYFGSELDQYHKDIEACIAAKTKIDNPGVLISHLSINKINGVWIRFDGDCAALIKYGSIFDLPENVEFEERIVPVKVWSNGVFNIISTPDSKSGKFGRSLNETKIEKVIHLKLKQEVKIEPSIKVMGQGYHINKPSKPLKVKEETQDELIRGLAEDFWKSNGTEVIKSKFKIQRIHPEQ